ncbi:MAG: ubiquinone biosynthesis protein UbiB, partial [Deltaproteobacteria bacterium]|nr:ubiquinone biosynthesis protein UbiB [Deltaproteobacteria bacterium]
MRLSTLLMAPWRLRDLGRIRRIAGVLVRHGFDDVAARLGWVGRLRTLWLALRRRRSDREPRVPVEQRIRLALEELGPTFIKLGQMMGTRPDLVPMSLVMELKKLHDEVPPF